MGPFPSSKQSNTGLQIDTSVANDTRVERAASKCISLYQQCSSLRYSIRSQLMRNHDVPNSALDSSLGSFKRSTNPVTQLWDFFALGIPLCYIFTLSPTPVISTDPNHLDVIVSGAEEHPIALLAMQIRRATQCEPFTVKDISSGSPMDGLAKAINMVTVLVDHLPEHQFVGRTDSNLDPIDVHTASPSPILAREAFFSIIRELVETDLNILQTYFDTLKNTLSPSHTISQDEICLLFPSLNNMLHVQRKFLIHLETVLGGCKDLCRVLNFERNDGKRDDCQIYCTNYVNAVSFVISETTRHVMMHDSLMNAVSDLPAFLIKPIRQICGYPWLLDSLIDISSVTVYFDHIARPTIVGDRLPDKNQQTVQDLESRINDWKGLRPSTFGDLILDDIFLVTEFNEVDHEYHVFLFEKFIICGRETKFLLKTRSVSEPLSKKNTPLSLKTYIYSEDLILAIPVRPGDSAGPSRSNQYALEMYWRAVDDDFNMLTLHCRSEQQLREWDKQISLIINERNGKGTAEPSAAEVVCRRASATPILDRPPSPTKDAMYPVWQWRADRPRSIPPGPPAGPRLRPPPRPKKPLDPLFTLTQQPQLNVCKNLLFELSCKLRMSKNPVTSHSSLTNILQTHVRHLSGMNAVESLANCHLYRAELIAMALELSCQDDPKIRMALDEDDAEIARLLKSIIESDADKKATLRLKGTDAEHFLNLMYRVLDKHPSDFDDNNELSRQKAHRLAVRLSVECGILPQSLVINGVEDCSKDNISGGGFADVFRAAYDGKAVALKRLRDYHLNQQREKIHRKFCKEALLWQDLKHPHVLPFYGIDLETFHPRLCMVSPWMAHGTLLNHIAGLGGPLGVNINKYLAETVQGLQYLHSRNIVHGDLRGNNIFIDENWNARLADFGLAGWTDATLASSTSNHAGSMRWMAPELLSSEVFRRAPSSDIYAYACVCLETYTGRYPFLDVSREATVVLKVMQGERPKRPSANDGKIMLDDLWELVELCWQQEPSNRPDVADIAKRMKEMEM